MQCDLIIAADNAKFGQPEIKLGVIPGIGGTQRFTRAVGKAKAMDIMLTGRMMDVNEAERAGLVARIVPLANLLDEAIKTAETIASMSLPSVLAAKEAVNVAFETSLAEGVRFERRVFQSLFATADQKEGMTAFIAKRPAKFETNRIVIPAPPNAAVRRICNKAATVAASMAAKAAFLVLCDRACADCPLLRRARVGNFPKIFSRFALPALREFLHFVSGCTRFHRRSVASEEKAQKRSIAVPLVVIPMADAATAATNPSLYKNQSLIDEAERALATGGDDGQAHPERVADLFAAGARGYSSQQIALFDDAAKALCRHRSQDAGEIGPPPCPYRQRAAATDPLARLRRRDRGR